MASRKLLISGYPEGTTSDQLMMYFQSRKKSGGGDVEDIELREGQAVITFEQEEGMLLVSTVCCVCLVPCLVVC